MPRPVLKYLFPTLAIFATVVLARAALVDTDGNAATNETFLGDLDMEVGTVADLSRFVTTKYTAAVVASATNTVADDLKEWTTNSVVVGYTGWDYSGNIVDSHTYSITSSESGGSYVFSLYDLTSAALIGNITTNILNPTVLVYPYDGGNITASREEIRRNVHGFAYYSDVKRLEDNIDTMDTSYFRFAGITNVNQSVQYVYTDASTTELRVLMPSSGMTKDWLVYVLAETNLTLNLPPATYWGASDSVTNAIPAYTPTALYFTQITDNTFSIGRKEFVPITVDSPMSKALKAARAKSRLGVRFYRPTLTKPAAKPAATATTAKPAAKPATNTTTAVKK